MPDRDLRDMKDVFADCERLEAEVAALKKERDAAVAKAALLEHRASAAPPAPAPRASVPAGVGSANAAVVRPQPSRPTPASVSTPRPPAPAPPPGAMTAELLAQALELMDRRREAERSQHSSDRLRERFTAANAKGDRIDTTSVDQHTAEAIRRLPKPVKWPPERL